MITVNFPIDKCNLACHAVREPVATDGQETFIRGKEPRIRLQQFKEAAEKLDRQSCRFLTAERLYTMMTLANHEGVKLSVLCRRLESFIKALLQEPAFELILKDTQTALESYSKEWLDDYEKSFEIISRLTGLKLDRSFDVYITHPCQRQGMNRSDRIFHTYRTGFPHYNTVYLWHEIMHSYLKPDDRTGQKQDYNASHAVIELLTDNELRCRLSNETYPPFQGHEFLDKTRECLLPSWREYVSGKDHDILKYLKQATELERIRLSGTKKSDQ
jgi:hypothetical protein